MTCGYNETFAGPKRCRKLQAVIVIASMNAMTVDWLSSSKFGSARPTSQNRADHNENDHGVDYRSLTESPADLAGNVLPSGTTCKPSPIRRHCTWVFRVMNHLNPATPQDELPRLLWACG
jgi:hypothetical protein